MKNGGTQTMKKIIAVTVALLLVLTLAGCSKDEPSADLEITGGVLHLR